MHDASMSHIIINGQRLRNHGYNNGDSKVSSASKSAGATRKSQSAEQNRNSNRKEINIAKMKRIGLVCQRVLAPSDRVTANPVRERVIVQNRNT